MKFLGTSLRFPGRSIQVIPDTYWEHARYAIPNLVVVVFAIEVELASAYDCDSVRYFGWIPSSFDDSIDSGASILRNSSGPVHTLAWE